MSDIQDFGNNQDGRDFEGYVASYEFLNPFKETKVNEVMLATSGDKKKKKPSLFLEQLILFLNIPKKLIFFISPKDFFPTVQSGGPVTHTCIHYFFLTLSCSIISD